MWSHCKFPKMLLGLSLLAALLLSSGTTASAAEQGTIKGTVKLQGTPPHMKGIDMSKEPYCAKAHAANPVHVENVVVGEGGGLQNVVVYISEGLPAGAAAIVPSKKPKFDQKTCTYVPHVMAVDVNQTYEVTTSDPLTHNIHPLPKPGSGNIGWNKSQPAGSPPLEQSWKAPEMIEVKCNIHPWMHGWHVVVRGPYGQTDEKGSFTIENVPPGSYTLTAWQEEYGMQTQKVTVTAGQAATADFTYKAK